MKQMSSVVLAVMVASVGLPRAASAEPALTDAEVISTNIGLVIGAATACRTVSPERISTVVGKAAEAVAAAATDEDELTSAHDLFKQNALLAKDQVEAGNIDCDRVDVAVAELERGM